MPREDESPLIVERVRVSRRGPLVVALVALSVVGVLLWKPWDQSIAAPTLSPIALLPTTNPTLQPSVPPPPIDVASIVDLDSTLVRCEYIQRGAGERLLAGLVVVPPRLEPQADIADSHVLEVSWHAEVQRNELDSMFSANWEQVAISDRQFSPFVTSPFLAFLPIHLDYADAPPAAASVLRVMIHVEWLGPRRTLLGSDRFVVTTYDAGGSGPPRIEGCHAVAA